jgi:hypothetical protein
VDNGASTPVVDLALGGDETQAAFAATGARATAKAKAGRNLNMETCPFVFGKWAVSGHHSACPPNGTASKLKNCISQESDLRIVHGTIRGRSPVGTGILGSFRGEILR